MLMSSLCDYSVGYLLVDRILTTREQEQRQFKGKPIK